MKRILLAQVGALALPLAISACRAATYPPGPAETAPTVVEEGGEERGSGGPYGSDYGPPAAEGPAGAGPTVATGAISLGAILVDGEGRTLYLNTNDTPENSSCYGGCAQAWPPLLAEGDPKAGIGVDVDLLGKISRDDGGVQVTYNGWPLYYFSGDAAPGDANGQGSGGVWFVLSPEGDAIR